MSNPVLACYNIAKTYVDGISKVEVLREMNLEIQPAEMVAIVGTSGSGKSTFLHLLAGLDKPTHGQVMLNGKNLYTLSENEKCFFRNHYLGFVYQFHHLLPEFTALENVGMPLLIRGDRPGAIREKAAHLLDQYGQIMQIFIIFFSYKISAR